METNPNSEESEKGREVLLWEANGSEDTNDGLWQKVPDFSWCPLLVWCTHIPVAAGLSWIAQTGILIWGIAQGWLKL